MILGILCMICGGGISVLLLREFPRRVWSKVRGHFFGASAQGVVTTITTEAVGSGNSARSIPRLVVKFTDARGIRVQYTEKVKRAGTVQPGEHFTVRFVPKDPEGTATIAGKADMRRELMLDALIILLFWGVFAFGLLMAIGAVPS
jgi:hypothetical protein